MDKNEALFACNAIQSVLICWGENTVCKNTMTINRVLTDESLHIYFIIRLSASHLIESESSGQRKTQRKTHQKENQNKNKFIYYQTLISSSVM